MWHAISFYHPTYIIEVDCQRLPKTAQEYPNNAKECACQEDDKSRMLDSW